MRQWAPAREGWRCGTRYARPISSYGSGLVGLAVYPLERYDCREKVVDLAPRVGVAKYSGCGKRQRWMNCAFLVRTVEKRPWFPSACRLNSLWQVLRVTVILSRGLSIKTSQYQVRSSQGVYSYSSRSLAVLANKTGEDKRDEQDEQVHSHGHNHNHNHDKWKGVIVAAEKEIGKMKMTGLAVIPYLPGHARNDIPPGPCSAPCCPIKSRERSERWEREALQTAQGCQHSVCIRMPPRSWERWRGLLQRSARGLHDRLRDHLDGPHLSSPWLQE